MTYVPSIPSIKTVNYLSQLETVVLSITKNTSAAATPDNGFVTSSTTNTYAMSTSSPLRGASSGLYTLGALGDQAVYDFTIDASDKYKVLQGSFEYAISSGTFADDAVTVWIYDTTNAVFIQPAPYKLKNHSMPAERFPFEFQTSGSTSYKLVLHQAAASTAVLKLDNFTLGPQAKLYGSSNTDEIAYTTTMTGGGSASFIPAKVLWWKQGSRLRATIQGTFSGAGSGGTGLRFTLPPGLTVDTSKTDYSGGSLGGLAGFARMYNVTGFSAVYGAFTLVVDGSPFNQIRINRTGSNSDILGQDILGSSTELEMEIDVPILGWSSSTIMSSDANTQVVAARSTRNGTSLTGVNTNASFMKIPFTATAFDKGGIFSSANSRFEIKSPGVYVANAKIWIGGTNSLNAGYFISIYKNGSEYSRGTYLLNPTAGNQLALGADARVECIAGDYLEVYMYGYGNNSASTLTVEGSAGLSYFEVSKISGPSQIAASETVNLSYSTSAAQSFTNSVSSTVIYGTKDFDSHNSYNSSTGVFTAPISGTYLITGSVAFSGLTINTGEIILQADKNGGAYTRLGRVPIGNSSFLGINGSVTMRLQAGETAQIVCYQSNGATRSLENTALGNRINITRVGNY